MRMILSISIILFAITQFLVCMEQEVEVKRILLKNFRKGPLDLFLSKPTGFDEFSVSVLSDTGTEYQMHVIPFKTASALIRNTYQAMEDTGIAAVVNKYDQKTNKEFIKFYNFMKDKDLPQQPPSISKITSAVNRLGVEEDNVEKFIEKVASLLEEKKSIVKYVNAASKDYNGDKNKAWQVAIEQIKIARAAYRNVYLNNDPGSCKTDWVLHPKSLYYKK